MHSTPIVHPSWLSVHGRALLGAIVVGGVALGTALAIREARVRIVHVPVPAPIPTVVTVETPAQTDEPPTKARAIKPVLDATCIAPLVDREGDGVSPCTWDDGMPAISGDGLRIATWVHGYDGDVALAFIDTQTQTVVSKMSLVGKNELVEYQVKPELVETVKTRATEMQHLLAEMQFRSMTELPSYSSFSDDPAPRGMYYEHATYEPFMRVVDGATNVQLWRGELEEDCPQKMGDVAPAWDPTTRVLFVQVQWARSEECTQHDHFLVRTL